MSLEDPDDGVVSTSHTFKTAAEVSAFLFGFRAAASEYVCAGMDEQNPCVLQVDLRQIDDYDEHAQEAWLNALNEYKERQEELGL